MIKKEPDTRKVFWFLFSPDFLDPVCWLKLILLFLCMAKTWRAIGIETEYCKKGSNHQIWWLLFLRPKGRKGGWWYWFGR
jgi:hypothetical protein